MAQLFDIKRVTVGPRALAAVVEVAPSAPLTTGEDPEATALVLDLMPALMNHACYGDAAPTFGEVVADTEIAHLLEHVTVELLALTNAAGDVLAGQTIEAGERTYEITLVCPDDVLVAGALSSAAWILQWAFSGGGDPRPDVAAIADGLVGLVESLDAAPAGEEPAPEDVEAGEPLEAGEAEAEQLSFEQAELAFEPEPEFAPATEPAFESDSAYYQEPELAPELAPEPAAEVPTSEPVPEPAPTPGDWDMDDVPRPRLVR